MTAFDTALFDVLALRDAHETPTEFLRRIIRDRDIWLSKPIAADHWEGIQDRVVTTPRRKRS